MNDQLTKILLIEDDPDAAYLIQKLLDRVAGTPFDLEWADRLSTGLERLSTGDIDVVLLDLLLPDSEGLDTFTRTHAQAPQVPIIMLSCLGDEELAIETVQAGAQDYLVKGKADEDLLVRAIHYAIERKRVEEALRESENRYRAISELVSDFAYSIRVTPDNKLVPEWSTEALLRTTGFSLDELIAHDGWQALIHPDDLPVFAQHLPVPASGQPSVSEYRLVTESGEVRWVREYRCPVWDEAHTRIVRIYGAAQDITEHKLVEEALREGEERMRLVVQNLPVMVDALDENGIIVMWNRELERVTGYSAEEMIGNPHALELLYPDKAYLDELWAALEKTRADFRDLEVTIACKDGTEKVIAWSNVSKHCPIPGWGTWAVGVDITERKRAENALRKGEEKMRAQYKSIPVPTYTWQKVGEDFVLVDYNDAAVAITQGNTADFVGMKASEMYQEMPEILDEFSRCFTEETSIERETVYRYKSTGASKHLAVKYAFVPPDLVMVHTEDITERKRAEEALKQRAAQLAFLNDIGGKIAAVLELDSVLERAAYLVQESFGYYHVTLFTVDHEEGELVMRARAGEFAFLLPPDHRLKLGQGIAGWVGSHGETLLANDVSAEPRYVGLSPDVILTRSELSVPIRAGEEIVGVIDIQSPQLGAFDENSVMVMETLADQIAVAIENARLFEEVRSARERLQALSHRLVEMQEAERHRIARELHDEIGQVLTGLKLVLDMVARRPVEQVKASLNEAQALVNELMTRVRDLSLDLRPAMLDDLGLLPALLWHIERYTAQTNVRVTFKHTGMERRRFAPEVETAAYRIVQEALTNVARHANVSEVTVRLWADYDVLGVQIKDQGDGFNPDAVLAAGESSGLAGMHERAVLLGGQLTVESAPGAGACVTVELPLGKPVEETKDEKSNDHDDNCAGR